jgi:hypothetical protein
MAKGLFITFTEAQLLTLRDNAFAAIAAGSTIVSWSDSGTSVGKSISMSAETVLDEVNHALRLRFPETYGAKLRHLSADLSNLDQP